MNNASLGLVAQQQTLFYEGRVFASKFRHEPDFLGIAKGFGWRTLDLDAANDPKDALAAALSAPGPAFIHARIDGREQVLPMVAPGGANKDMIGE
jgi:acetolactate synthase-1/2/3 large subunit